MMRMNMENPNNKLTQVKKNCANCESDFTCNGAMIDSSLRTRIDGNLAGKTCVIKKGKECDYFNFIVKPSIAI